MKGFKQFIMRGNVLDLAVATALMGVQPITVADG